MHRRDFLTGSLLAAVAGCSAKPPAASRDSSAGGSVRSEVGLLSRVLVHTPGEEIFRTFPMLAGDHSMLTWELVGAEIADQHREFVRLLKSAGAQVVQLRDALDQAIDRAKQQGAFQSWLDGYAPDLAGRKVSAATLLGEDSKTIYAERDGGFRPQIDPRTTLFFTRDMAAVAPAGAVICNFHNAQRRGDALLARFLFEYSPLLADCPIAFDAAAEHVHLEGGDLLVLDEQTLLLGVGNETQEAAAIRLAQRLKMNVVAVDMPPRQWRPLEWDGLRSLFYHLDCLVNFVDRRRLLAAPYLLQTEHAQDNPLLQVVRGLSQASGLDAEESELILQSIRDVGWIRRYEAESGRLDDTIGRIKLLDYLQPLGYKAVFVGGAPPQDAGPQAWQYVVEQMMRECRFMAGNVVAVGPGRVIAYSGNSHTQTALQAAGVKVLSFEAHQLVRTNGGPHCLTLPLARKPLTTV